MCISMLIISQLNYYYVHHNNPFAHISIFPPLPHAPRNYRYFKCIVDFRTTPSFVLAALMMPSCKQHLWGMAWNQNSVRVKKLSHAVSQQASGPGRPTWESIGTS